MRTSRPACLVLVTLSILSLAGRSKAERPAKAFDPDGVACEAGETPAYFRRRFEWYLDRYGVGGMFEPQRRLDQVRELYAGFLKERTRTRAALSHFSPGTFRFVGPANGAGRLTAVEPHPTDLNTLWVGAAGGGAWKSSDGGATWRALTDGLGDLSVGAVSAAPSNDSVLYLGTGEGGYATDFIPGIGILKSVDGGDTWQLPQTVVSGAVYRLSVDPRNPIVVLAFCGGSIGAGVQRSTDGGTTWTRTSNPAWGDATDAARDPLNADLVHAVFWNRSGESSRYARSSDNGVTWNEITTGLPDNPKGRMSLAASGDGQTLYVLVSKTSAEGYGTLGIWRSTDGGSTWSKRGLTTNVLGSQGWYDNVVAVDPDSADSLLLGGVNLYRSTDGAQTATRVDQSDGVHADHHQLVFRKYGSTKLAFTANDGGLWRSTDGGTRWQARNTGLATRQYYAVALDPTNPNVYFAGSQDNGSDRVQSDTGGFVRVLGGDGFEPAVNPDNPAVVFLNLYDSRLYRSTTGGITASAFVPVNQPLQADGETGALPFLTWVTLDPNGPRTLYTGTWRFWRSEDGGETFTPLDAALLNTKRETVALAVAKGKPERILAAQRTALFLSNDRGKTLAALSGGLPNATIRSVEIDPGNPDVFFVCFGSNQPNLTDRVYRSADAGASWTRADSGLPSFGIEVVRVDPGDSQTVYAGTLVGLYRSQNGGTTWQRWGDGLPAVAVHDVRVAPDGSRMVVATHGRGLWASDGLGANQPPAVAITSPGGDVAIDAGEGVAFAGASSDPDGDAVSLLWDFGDGMTGAGASPGSVTYRTPGLYRVALVGVDAPGGRGAAYVNVTVRPPNAGCANSVPVSLVPGATVVVRSGNAGAPRTVAGDPLLPTTSSCVGSGGTYLHPLWYSFVPPADGTVDLDTWGTLGDTAMALFQGACSAAATPLDCNDDAPDAAGGYSKLTTQSVVKGATYRILAASWGTQSGSVGAPVDVMRVRALFRPAAADAAGPGTTALLPAVLDAFGKNGARFTSDSVLLNRGTAPLGVSLTWGGPVGGGLERATSLVLPAGAQLRASDALAELRRQGIAVPLAGTGVSPVGSLTALVTSGDPTGLVLASRTASPNPNVSVGGSFGLFSTGTSFDDAAGAEDAVVFGLRQTDVDRANLAVVHVRTPLAGDAASQPITVEVRVFDAAGRPAPTTLTATLQPGEWKQFDAVLAQAGAGVGTVDGGWARIRRTAGAGRFVAYGVINDQKTADGSLIRMTRGGGSPGDGTVTVPIVLEAKGAGTSFFTSELVLGNTAVGSGTVAAELRYSASPLLGGGVGSGTVSVDVPAGGQVVLPNFIQLLRDRGLPIPAGNAGGALFVRFAGVGAGDTVFAGARVSTPNPDTAQGGAFGVFSPGLPTGELFDGSATIAALRKDAAARANLAVVNAGTSPIELAVALRSSANGSPLGSTLTRSLGPGEWYQWSDVFGKAAAEPGEAWAVVTRTSGSAPWYAYGVLNDEKTSDGSLVGGVN
jgi:hypothetical protein